MKSNLHCPQRSATLCLTLVASLAAVGNIYADVKVPNIFGSHMVLQQGQANPVWGWADPGEQVTVMIGDQTHSTKAGDDGRWQVKLASLPVGGPHELSVKGKNELKFADVLVGEVWVCSGQSNMQWSVAQSDDADLEKLTAKNSMIRLVTVPQVGTQEPQDNFVGAWAVCSSDNVGDFSAVGYFFGRQLQETLGVPIGLIDNAWGGSACEAWVSRDRLAADDRYKPLLDRWTATEASYDHEEEMAGYQAKRKVWEEGGKQGNAPSAPRNPLTGQHRPANLYNGVLKPIIGYGIRGAIWYQGETNAGRAYQYRHLFPLMIQEWRDDWGQGDFPFYWVQLADFMDESDQPQDSAWAELREAQTMTMTTLPNTGEAVITDLGEAHDIHPKNKQGVGKRLARWALARDYGIDITYKSPQYKSMEKQGNKIVVTFDIGETGSGSLDTFDVRDPIGFSIAGEDKAFVWAKARIVGRDKVEVWNDAVGEPASVRYAWANNPICNLQNAAGLPATPFRTDHWPGVTADSQ